eukprot:TRINITY_DN50414_c0_g1_i3.p1 TRINITY_DN50414_c0_g1~~TRINITY_DN50414_c0_g1_i3.p1  ORF type:complete len:292 (+),score=68.40 TRINITY_DN50414_c0_g1_i3:202-1077(+)
MAMSSWRDAAGEDSGDKIVEKNTFLEVITEPKARLRRSLSDSDIESRSSQQEDPYPHDGMLEDCDSDHYFSDKSSASSGHFLRAAIRPMTIRSSQLPQETRGLRDSSPVYAPLPSGYVRLPQPVTALENGMLSLARREMTPRGLEDRPPPQQEEPLQPDLPSAGSALHEKGECTPCFQVNSKLGCGKGRNCAYCHVPHEKKVRKRPCKSKRDQLKRLAEMVGEGQVPLEAIQTNAKPMLSSSDVYLSCLLKGPDGMSTARRGGNQGGETSPNQDREQGADSDAEQMVPVPL